MLVCVGSVLASKAHAASFDCRLARTSVEQAICLDPELSALDERMAALFKAALPSQGGANEFRQTQRDWLRLVRNRCSTRECLRGAYQERITNLQSGRPLDLSDTPAGAGVISALQGGETRYQKAAVDGEQAVVRWLQDTKSLETAVEVASKYVPRQFLPSFTARHCADQAGFGAYFVNSANQVHVCYEFVRQLLLSHAAHVENGGSNWNDEQSYALDAIRFVVWHETAHALLHRNRDGGSLGPEEAEADNIAGVLLLLQAPDETAVRRAVWAVHRLTSAMGAKANYSNAEFADEHLLPQQRLVAFACLAVGRSPTLSSWLGQILPERRATRCRAEWTRRIHAVSALFKRLQ